jgi:predicted metal-dependent hydrolase
MKQTFLRFFNRSNPPKPAQSDSLMIDGQNVPLVFVRNLRARRYLLRLRPDGVARVTIPRGGSAAEARRFVERHTAWLATQLKRLPQLHPTPQTWQVGSEILFRGQRVRIEIETNGRPEIRLGPETVRVPAFEGDLRHAIEKHLHRIATKELPARVHEFATLHQLSIRRVTVRSQRSRWGSCSRNGTISLNWRLIQTPDFVRDYIVLHELMHLRQMNHSARYWREVASVCPDYQTAERWLKQNRGLLRL